MFAAAGSRDADFHACHRKNAYVVVDRSETLCYLTVAYLKWQLKSGKVWAW